MLLLLNQNVPAVLVGGLTNPCPQYRSAVSPIIASCAVVAQFLAFLAQVLWVTLGLVGDIQPIWLLQRPLLVGVDTNVTLLAFLSGVCPTVATHPGAIALWALVLPETTSIALVWCLRCNTTQISFKFNKMVEGSY